MNNKNGIAPMGVCSSPSGLRKSVSNKHYNTSVNTPVNNIDPDGDRDARMKAMVLLKRKGYSNFQSPDWLAKNPEGKTETIEVKYKKLYEPPPFWGAGLNVSQVKRRTQLLKELGLRTYLIVFAKGTDEVYGAYLDELEKGIFYDTRNGIRIYPIDHFKAIHDALNQNLGGLV